MKFSFYNRSLLIFCCWVVLPVCLFSQTKTKDDSIKAEVDQMVKEATQTYFIVFAGVSTDFNHLDSVCKKIEKVTGEKYSNNLVYDNKRGMIVPDTSSDGIYAGSYYPRRGAEENARTSVEMLWYYSKSKEGWESKDKRMVILTGVFGTKAEAETNLKKVKRVVPDAYLKPVDIYMGCMH